MVALTRPFYTLANRPFDDVSTTLRSAQSGFFAQKQAWLGITTGYTVGPEGAPPGTAAHTIIGSSDGATAGMDGIDRMTNTYTPAKLVRAAAGVAHSWIVTMKNGFYYCLDFAGASDQAHNIYIAKTAFTGGSITARPTSTTEAQSILNATFIESSTTQHKTHYIVDANGYGFFLQSRNGSGICAYSNMILPLASARPGDVGNVMFYEHFLASGIGTPNPETQTSIGAIQYDGLTAIVTGTCRWATPYAAGSLSSVLTSLNAQDSKIDLLPYHCVVGLTAGKLGVRGTFLDCYMSAAQGAVGSPSPSTGQQKFTRVGAMVIPCSVGLSL